MFFGGVILRKSDLIKWLIIHDQHEYTIDIETKNRQESTFFLRSGAGSQPRLMGDPKKEFAFVIVLACALAMIISIVAAWLLSLPL